MKNRRNNKLFSFGIKKPLNWFNFYVVGFVILFLMRSVPAMAVDVTNVVDLMSNQTMSSSSSHRFGFNLSSSNTFSSGEVIAIDFPSSFSLTGTWQAADFDFIDSIARDIEAVNQGSNVSTVDCTQVDGNEVGIAVDTSNAVFRVIPCTGAFTASSAGASVTFIIDGVSPAGVLTNPGSVGSYIINITNAAGDCSGGCRVGVPIINTGEVNVIARIAGICGNGIIESGEQCDDGNTTPGDGCSATCTVEGGGAPVVTDTTPPIIDFHCASNITVNSAVLSWDTNEDADSLIRCGLRSNVYTILDTDAAFARQHRVMVDSLSPATTYFCQACSTDSSSNTGCSNECSFSTLDLIPPIINGPFCGNATQTSFTVTWSTNENATSVVDYGAVAGPPYGSSVNSLNLVTNHSLTVTGLTGGTTYHYRVRSSDFSGNEALTADTICSTTGGVLPLISNVHSNEIGCSSANISWITNIGTNSTVDYGQVVGPPYSGTTSNASLVTDHTLTLIGLLPGSTYHYRTRSADSSANEVASADQSFTTSGGGPLELYGLQVFSVSSNNAIIHWVSNRDANSVVEYGPTVHYGGTVNLAPAVTDHSVELSDLQACTTYQFHARSTDLCGISQTSDNLNFTTTPTPAPSITNVLVSHVGERSVRVTWVTSQPTRTTLDYGATPTYGEVISNATWQRNHLAVLSSLRPGTTYHFRIQAVDSCTQRATTSDAQFTTVADVTPPACTVGLNVTSGDAINTLSWINPPDGDLAGTQIVRRVGGCPADISDGTVVFNSRGNFYTDRGLTNGIAYCYAAFPYDDSGNFGCAAIGSGMPNSLVNNQNNPNNQDNQPNQNNQNNPPNNANNPDNANNQANQNIPNNGNPPDIGAPSSVSNLQLVSGDGRILLTWENPAEASWAGTRVVRRPDRIPTGAQDGTVVFDDLGDSVMDTGLTNDTTYYYGVFAHDRAANFSSGVFGQGVPILGAPQPVAECTDSDGGRNYLLQGVVQLVDGSRFTDVCLSRSLLEEEFCRDGQQTTEQHDCGAGFKCSAGRCTADIPEPAVAARCGDGICSESENNVSCPLDCPATVSLLPTQTAEVTVLPEEHKTVEKLKFFATKGSMPLAVANSTVDLFPSMAVAVVLPVDAARPVKSAYLQYDEHTYLLTATKDSFEGRVISPAMVGSVPFKVFIELADGSKDVVTGNFRVVPFGVIKENKDDKVSAVDGARVTLLADIGGGNYAVWDGTPFGQFNPAMSNKDGSYGFIVPAGKYILQVEKDGYRTQRILPFPVANNLVGRDFRLLLVPIQKITENPVAYINYGASVVSDQVKDFISNPIVEKDATTSVGVTTLVVTTNVAVAGATSATAVPYGLYLYSLISHPGAFLAMRRRKKWGVVYNSITKQPLDLVIVRLLNAQTGTVVRSTVTDKEGRYFFTVNNGQYRLVVVKAAFIFPTVYLNGEKNDARFTELYHGEVIESVGGAPISVNIPVDPVAKEKTPRRVVWEGIFRRFQTSISVIALLMSLGTVIITPSRFTIGLFIINLGLYLVFNRLVLVRKIKNWGVVFDKRGRRPLRNAIVRVFEAKYNKLLETKVTDMSGRYAFLVGHNVYYLTCEKFGYFKKQLGPFDLQAEKSQEFIAENLPMVPVEAQKVGSFGERLKAVFFPMSRLKAQPIESVTTLVSPETLPTTEPNLGGPPVNNFSA